MPTNEKRREAAKRKLDRQIARRAERAKARRRYAVAGAAGAVVLLIGVVALIVTLSRGGGNTAASPPTPPAPASPGSDTARLDTKIADPPVRPNPLPASVDCQYPAQDAPARPVQPPLTGGTDAKGTVPATMQTSVGAIGLTLDRALAPCTVNSFLSLAKQGFYANTPCHRLVTSPSLHVLQCGDPTGAGTGGPGYTIPDEVFPELTYGRGYIAMANTGAPNSGGSQFFLVYGQTRLPPSYTVFGTISEDGLKVIDQVAKAGDDGSRSPGDGKPNQQVTITAVETPAA